MCVTCFTYIILTSSSENKFSTWFNQQNSIVLNFRSNHISSTWILWVTHSAMFVMSIYFFFLERVMYHFQCKCISFGFPDLSNLIILVLTKRNLKIPWLSVSISKVCLNPTDRTLNFTVLLASESSIRKVHFLLLTTPDYEKTVKRGSKENIPSPTADSRWLYLWWVMTDILMRRQSKKGFWNLEGRLLWQIQWGLSGGHSLLNIFYEAVRHMTFQTRFRKCL